MTRKDLETLLGGRGRVPEILTRSLSDIDLSTLLSESASSSIS